MSASGAQEIRELRQKVKDLASRLEDNSKDALDDADSNIIGFNRRELRQMAKRAGRNVKDFINEKNQQAVELRENAEETISSHPFRSLAYAALGGVVLGAIFGRK